MDIQDICTDGIVQYSPETESPDITVSAKDQIIQYLREHTGVVPADRMVPNVKNSVYSFEWDWKSKTGGKIMKRFSRYIKDIYDYSLSSDDLNKIGNMVNAGHLTGEVIYYDIVDHANWNAGDFGDGGSCYWGGRAGAKDMILNEAGGGAIRCYEKHFIPGSNYRGLGRAWLVPVTVNGETFWTMFNGYHRRENNATQYMSNIFSAVMGLKKRSIDASNNGDDEGTLWLNGSTYIFGTEEQLGKIKSIHDIDFGIVEREYHYCYECDQLIDEDYDNYIIDVDYGNYYHLDCTEDAYVFLCDRCGDWHRGDGYTVFTENGEETWCSDCRNHHSTTCDHCGEYVDDGYVGHYEEIGHICNDCLDEYHTCERCGTLTKRDDGLCNTCYQEDNTICHMCGKEHSRDLKYRTYSGLSICWKCAAKLRDLLLPMDGIDFKPDTIISLNYIGPDDEVWVMPAMEITEGLYLHEAVTDGKVDQNRFVLSHYDSGLRVSHYWGYPHIETVLSLGKAISTMVDWTSTQEEISGSTESRAIYNKLQQLVTH